MMNFRHKILLLVLLDITQFWTFSTFVIVLFRLFSNIGTFISFLQTFLISTFSTFLELFILFQNFLYFSKTFHTFPKLFLLFKNLFNFCHSWQTLSNLPNSFLLGFSCLYLGSLHPRISIYVFQPIWFICCYSYQSAIHF